MPFYRESCMKKRVVRVERNGILNVSGLAVLLGSDIHR